MGTETTKQRTSEINDHDLVLERYARLIPTVLTKWKEGTWRIKRREGFFQIVYKGPKNTAEWKLGRFGFGYDFYYNPNFNPRSKTSERKSFIHFKNGDLKDGREGLEKLLRRLMGDMEFHNLRLTGDGTTDNAEILREAFRISEEERKAIQI